MADLTLSNAELYNITGYKSKTRQLRELKDLGIPAKQRTDGTIRVLRMHLEGSCPVQPVNVQRPRPKLRSSR